MPVLDTTFLVDLLRKRPDALRKLEELEEKRCFFATTAVNMLEIYRGVFLSSDLEKNLSLIRLVMEEIPVLPVTEEVYPVFGELSAYMSRMGAPVGDLDEIIAAITLCYDRIIVTRDNHFSSIPGLIIEGY